MTRSADTYVPEIAFSDVSVSLNQTTLLAALDLTIAPGTWLGVVGPNGGGKSTLIKALLGIVPHQGEIALTWPGQQPGNIGYVPQLAPFDATLPITVLDYLRMVNEPRPVWLRYRENRQITEQMAAFEIRDFAHKRIGTLSTGERQRVLLCGALLNQPSVLVLDEPFAGVDKRGRQVLLTLLADYHQQGNTVIMVEHQWQIVARFCQRVVLIDGTLQGDGHPDAILALMQSRAASFDFEHVKEGGEC